MYTLSLRRLFHFRTKCASAFDWKIGSGTNDVCRILFDPNCISDTNYTEKENRNTKYKNIRNLVLYNLHTIYFKYAFQITCISNIAQQCMMDNVV